MPRTEEEYGLPRLTLAEMSRVLGVDKGELWNWIVTTVKPGPNRFTEWQSDSDETPIPEKLIRLYLAQRADLEGPIQRELREIKALLRGPGTSLSPPPDQPRDVPRPAPGAAKPRGRKMG